LNYKPKETNLKFYLTTKKKKIMMTETLFQFSVSHNDPLSKTRVPFPPVLFGYHWEKRYFQVPFDPEEEGKFVELVLCEERSDETFNHFSESESLALKDGYSSSKIINGIACINLGEGAENISKNCRRTNPVFVLVFKIDDLPKKISERFHVRSKWALSKNEEANIGSLISRIRSMNRVIPNEILIKQIEIVKQKWREAKDESKTREQRIATATWLQTKLVNFSEKLFINDRYLKIEKCFFKTRKPNRSPPKSLEIIQDLLKEIELLEMNSEQMQSLEYNSNGMNNYIFPSEIDLNNPEIKEEQEFFNKKRKRPNDRGARQPLPLPMAQLSTSPSQVQTMKKEAKKRKNKQLSPCITSPVETTVFSYSQQPQQIQQPQIQQPYQQLQLSQPPQPLFQRPYYPNPNHFPFFHNQPFPILQPSIEESLFGPFDPLWINPENILPFLLSPVFPSTHLFGNSNQPNDSHPSDQMIYFLTDSQNESQETGDWSTFDNPDYEE